MSGKTMPAVYLCGPGPIVRQPCSGGGPDHMPMPDDYAGRAEYADQLMWEGWTQPEPCSHCQLWGHWVPPQPMPAPPMRHVYDNPAWQAAQEAAR